MSKNTSKRLSEKIITYGAITASLSAFADMNGQIIFTDVNPDFETSDGQFILDIDNNGIDDFKIFGNPGYLQITPYNNNEVRGIGYGGEMYIRPYALALSDPITNLSSSFSYYFWNNEEYGQLLRINSYSSGTNCFLGYWCNVEDGYLGLRFNLDGETLYGWVRMAVNEERWIVKGHAFNTIDGQGVRAGTTEPVLNLESNILNDINIITSNKRITVSNITIPVDYTLYALNGKQILNGKLSDGTQAIDTQIATGIYILKLIEPISNAIITKKIVL